MTIPTLEEILSAALAANASDVHLKGGAPAVFRVQGRLAPAEMEPLTPEWMQGALEQLLPADSRERFAREKETDFSHQSQSSGRFRINIFQQRGEPAISMRAVKTEVATVKELHLPAIINDLCEARNGLIVLGGATGSGKSTTLAAMIDHLNRHHQKHIITLEDPIEFLFRDGHSVIEQREIGVDTASFATGLRNVLRQDPDVLVIGEMRDGDSLSAAMRSVNTGHLVLTTLHTDDAARSIQRMLEFFPATEHEHMRRQIASALKAVICQRLVPCESGQLLPAVELLISNSTVRGLIEDDRLEDLQSAIETGSGSGMLTFNQSLHHLIKANLIDEVTALRHSPNPEALRMNLRGIFSAGGTQRILGTGKR